MRSRRLGRQQARAAGADRGGKTQETTSPYVVSLCTAVPGAWRGCRGGGGRRHRGGWRGAAHGRLGRRGRGGAGRSLLALRGRSGAGRPPWLLLRGWRHSWILWDQWGWCRHRAGWPLLLLRRGCHRRAAGGRLRAGLRQGAAGAWLGSRGGRRSKRWAAKRQADGCRMAQWDTPCGPESLGS